jgi:hypothetical protein
VSGLRRGPWMEIELPSREGELLMLAPGWTNDRTGLLLPLRETGWFSMGWEASDAVANAVLSWIWIGVNDDSELVECSWDGLELATGEDVSDVRQVTLAQVGSGQTH